MVPELFLDLWLFMLYSKAGVLKLFALMLVLKCFFVYTVKPEQNDHSEKYQKMVFKTNFHLMQVKSIESILQYF